MKQTLTVKGQVGKYGHTHKVEVKIVGHEYKTRGHEYFTGIVDKHHEQEFKNQTRRVDLHEEMQTRIHRGILPLARRNRTIMPRQPGDKKGDTLIRVKDGEEQLTRAGEVAFEDGRFRRHWYKPLPRALSLRPAPAAWPRARAAGCWPLVGNVPPAAPDVGQNVGRPALVCCIGCKSSRHRAG